MTAAQRQSTAARESLLSAEQRIYQLPLFTPVSCRIVALSVHDVQHRLSFSLRFQCFSVLLRPFAWLLLQVTIKVKMSGLKPGKHGFHSECHSPASPLLSLHCARAVLTPSLCMPLSLSPLQFMLLET